MLRQRVHTRRPTLRIIGKVLVGLLALALIWYGAMLVLLAVKVSPGTVDELSGYRTAYDFLAGLTPGDVDGWTRAIIAGAGIAALLIFGFLVFKELPRPYLARHDVELTRDAHGCVVVEPRVIERLAAHAACEQPAVVDASGRYGVDELVVGVTVRRPGELARTLEESQRAVHQALARSELPTMPVTLTLTGFDAKPRRELN